MSRRLLVLVLATGLLASGAAVSGAPPAAAANKVATLTVITDLHQAHTLLETAIHDYDGHRGKAQHEVHLAVKDLEEHHRKTNPGVALPKAPAAAVQAANPPAEKPAPTPEQQKASDAQLQQALGIITQMEQALSTSTHPGHLKAAAHLKVAIAELNTALSIK